MVQGVDPTAHTSGGSCLVSALKLPLSSIDPRAGVQLKKPPASAWDCKGQGNGWKGPGRGGPGLWAWRGAAFSPPSFPSVCSSILYLKTPSVWSTPSCLALRSASDTLLMPARWKRAKMGCGRAGAGADWLRAGGPPPSALRWTDDAFAQHGRLGGSPAGVTGCAS